LELRETALAPRHRALGARLVPFSGWNMPVQYSGIVEEHKAVRERAGLFDVSHMGRFVVRGPKALVDLEALTSNRVAKLEIGQFQYSSLPNPRGGLTDDILVGRTGESEFQVVVNAGNLAVDRDQIRAGLSKETEFVDESQTHGILALQGPKAAAVLARIAPDLDGSMGVYHCGWATVAGGKTFLSRTGYTGEDGFEIYPALTDLVKVWDALLDAGKPDGILPCGLGARDSLRLEAGYSLYGHELSDSLSPLETGLAWITDLSKDFTGAQAMRVQKAAGVPHAIVGLAMEGKSIPRQGYEVYAGEAKVGVVTSGTRSPTLGKGIALALVRAGSLSKGQQVSIDVRGRKEPAQVVDRRFVRRGA
jgi:aminomethyltransferase